MINEKEKRSSDYLYLMVEFPSIVIDGNPYSIVYFEQDGDEVYQFRVQADIVTVPDQEILKVCITLIYLAIIPFYANSVKNKIGNRETWILNPDFYHFNQKIIMADIMT